LFDRLATAVGLLAVFAALCFYAIPRLFPGGSSPALVTGIDLARILSEHGPLDRTPPAVPEVDRELAAKLSQATADNAGEGAEWMRRHLEEQGETALRRAALGFMLLLDQQAEAGRKELARALELDPACSCALVATAGDELRHGRFARAEEGLRKALSERATNADWQRLYATTLLGTGKIEEALRAAECSVALAPKTPASYLAAGDVHLRSGRIEMARRWYEAACELAGPDSELTKNHLPILAVMRERAGF
jgi:tetratricopeptide (TPR) repeat protein